MEQTNIAVNPQEISDLSWLGGLIDGEGCIEVQLANQKYGAITLYPRITLGNTNKYILQEVERIFKQYYIAYYIRRHSSKSKDMWLFHISGYKRAYRLAKLIHPYIKGKKVQIDNLVKFLHSRLESDTIDLPYTDEELQYVKNIIMDKDTCSKEHHLKRLEDYRHYRDNIRYKSLIGRKFSEEHRRKLSEKAKGRKASEETRRKLSQAKRGENSPWWGRKHTLETRQKMSQFWKGKRCGKDNANYGKTLSEETRRKISEGLKEYNQKRRSESSSTTNTQAIQESLDDDRVYTI